jgi:hypothetical protein
MIYAMFAMILLTSVVAGYLLKLRIAAVKAGEVSLGSFRLNTSTDMPPKIMQAARNFSNLFEVPVLFYTGGTLALALHLETASMIVVSWIFVIARAVHSWIHITNNNVIHRMQAFVLSCICVLLIWILILLQYVIHSNY